MILKSETINESGPALILPDDGASFRLDHSPPGIVFRIQKTDTVHSSPSKFTGLRESAMNSANMVEQGHALEPVSKAVSRSSLLTALVVSQAYLIHATFFAHALTPISVFVIDPKTHLHLLSGQIGNIEEVFHWDGFIPTILLSVLVFVVGWMAARGTARLLAGLRPIASSGQTIDINSLKLSQRVIS
jgi:hypothetical protein